MDAVDGMTTLLKQDVVDHVTPFSVSQAREVLVPLSPEVLSMWLRDHVIQIQSTGSGVRDHHQSHLLVLLLKLNVRWKHVLDFDCLVLPLLFFKLRLTEV